MFVEVNAGGITGRGEASPNAYYDETTPNVLGLLKAAGDFVADLKIETVADIERTWLEVWPWLAPSRAAQCALDLALWDWLARSKGLSVAELALGESPHPVRTFCTIGLCSPPELETQAMALRGFPLIKIKSDALADIAPIRFIRQITGAILAVDANGAWSRVDPASISRELAGLGVLFIEQPLPSSDDERMSEWVTASTLPIMADESCVTLEDVERLPGRYSGFNIKLVKCGGLTPALAMLRRGRELGLHTMVGCMLESSLLISAGMVVAQRADYADLDGAWLLRNDPFAGLPLRQGVLTLEGRVGFGVEPTEL